MNEENFYNSVRDIVGNDGRFDDFQIELVDDGSVSISTRAIGEEDSQEVKLLSNLLHEKIPEVRVLIERVDEWVDVIARAPARSAEGVDKHLREIGGKVIEDFSRAFKGRVNVTSLKEEEIKLPHPQVLGWNLEAPGFLLYSPARGSRGTIARLRVSQEGACHPTVSLSFAGSHQLARNGKELAELLSGIPALIDSRLEINQIVRRPWEVLTYQPNLEGEYVCHGEHHGGERRQEIIVSPSANDTLIYIDTTIGETLAFKRKDLSLTLNLLGVEFMVSDEKTIELGQCLRSILNRTEQRILREIKEGEYASLAENGYTGYRPFIGPGGRTYLTADPSVAKRFKQDDKDD